MCLSHEQSSPPSCRRFDPPVPLWAKWAPPSLPPIQPPSIVQFLAIGCRLLPCCTMENQRALLDSLCPGLISSDVCSSLVNSGSDQDPLPLLLIRYGWFILCVYVPSLRPQCPAESAKLILRWACLLGLERCMWVLSLVSGSLASWASLGPQARREWM